MAVHWFEYRDSLFSKHDTVPATLSFNPFTIYPHTNWRGDYQTGTWTTRETQRCARVPQNTEDYETEPDTPLNPGGITVASSWMHCLAAVKWPAKYIWLDHSTRAQPPGSDELWIGSLVYNKRDLAGNVYMRNRYYNAAAGRFSQEDPIGLAGGLNAYGFAAGDPVSYSDPYGLCPRITVSGNNVTIEANIVYVNMAVADQTRVAQGITNAWSGSSTGYSVTVNLNVSNAPTIEVFGRTAPLNGKDGLGGSFGLGAGGQMMVVTAHSESTVKAIAGHEFGHVMTLGHSPNPQDLMFHDYQGGSQVTQSEMAKAIANCTEQPEAADENAHADVEPST